MNKDCNCKKPKPCGCNEVEYCGCKTKVDLHCSFYSGDKLLPTNIEKGDTGNLAIKKINDYLKNLPDSEFEPTLMDNIGGKIEVYKGQNPGTLIHEFKTIQGLEGIIVEDAQGTGSCNTDEFINVRINKDWLIDFLNQWIKTVDLCPLIQNCTVPPVDPPVAEDLVFNLPNQIGKTFSESDFQFTDPGGGLFTSFRLIGSVGDYRLNNQVYTPNTEVQVFDLQQGLFKFVAPVTNNLVTTTVDYQTKSSTGQWSNVATLTIVNAAKIIASFSPVTVDLVRGISNTKTATVNYTNGNGQQFNAGTTIYTTGIIGQPGYIKVTFLNNTTLSSNGGSFDISITSIPYSTLVGNPNSITYTIDSGQGIINFSYSSIPVTNNDILKTTPYLQSFNFTVGDFTNNSSDLDGDIVQARILPITTAGVASSLTGYKYNGVQYDGSWMGISTLSQLSYEPDDITAGYQKVNKWQVKDAKGNISE